MSISLHWLFRGSAPEALGLAPSATRKLEAAGEVLPTTHAPLSPDAATVALETIVSTADEITDAAAAVAKEAQRQPLSFLDALGKHVEAFLVSELEKKYVTWRHSHLGAWKDDLVAWAQKNSGPGVPAMPAFTEVDRLAYAKELGDWAEQLHAWTPVKWGRGAVPRRLPLDYATGVRSGRSHLLLSLLFSDNYRNLVRDMAGLRGRRFQAAALWPRLVSAAYPPAGPNAVPNLRRLLQLAPPVHAPDMPPSVLRAEVARVAADTKVNFDPQFVDAATLLIRRLAARYAPGGDIAQLTDKGLMQLMGNTALTSDEFIHRSLVAFEIMADEAGLIGPELLTKLLDVDGIETFLSMALKKSGHEHGYAFEVFLVLRKLYDEVSPADIWMQLVVAGRQGPDIGRVMLNAVGQRVVRLTQAKSFQDIGAIMRPTASGEIFSQIRSDLLRLAKDGFMVTGPDGTVLAIDETIEFAVDWFHLRRTAFRIDGIKPGELHGLHEASDAVRDAFFERYVRENTEKIQAMLDSPEFRDELAKLAHPRPVPSFKLEVSVVDRIFPDG
jgi:hypothetical protein